MYNIVDCACMRAQSLHSCLTLCDPMDCSPGSPVHGIPQARILEWVAIPSSRGSSRPRDWTCSSWTVGGFLPLGHRESPGVLSTHLHTLSGFVTHPWGHAAGVPGFEVALGFSLSRAWTPSRHLWALLSPLFSSPSSFYLQTFGCLSLAIEHVFLLRITSLRFSPFCHLTVSSTNLSVRIVERIQTLESYLDLNPSF